MRDDHVSSTSFKVGGKGKGKGRSKDKGKGKGKGRGKGKGKSLMEERLRCPWWGQCWLSGTPGPRDHQNW